MNPLYKAYCRAYQLAFRAALPILPYTEPKLLGSLEAIPHLLAEQGKGAALVVVDAAVRNLGLIEPLEEALVEAKIDYDVYEQRTPNPTVDDVEAAREVYLSCGAQAIIAVGGGSAIDCAKAVGARIARPRLSVQKMKGILRIMKRTPLFIAVPTTAGTGSEATLAAVITDQNARHKYPINDFPLIPDYAVLDAKLTLGLPPFITATTGLDALTHAVEAYIGRSTTRHTREMSEEAVRLIRENLITAVEDGQNEHAREAMLRAAYCAGVAFTRSYVGYVHGVAHSLGGEYGIAHGLANAVILPNMLERYGESCHKRLAKLARATGIAQQEADDAGAAHAFIAWVRGLNARFGLPAGFPEIRHEDIPHMARHAANESNPLYPVPRLMDRFELEGVYRELMCSRATGENVGGAIAGDANADGANADDANAGDDAQQPAKPDIAAIVAAQRAFYQTGKTLPIRARRDALHRLRLSILANEDAINAALKADLNKSPDETYMCETGMTLSELSYMEKHVAGFARRRRKLTPLAQFLASSYTVRDPLGVVLIMSPWNYPFMLTMEPLIGAIAAGNCCVLKPSAYSPATSAVIAKIVRECFPPQHVTVVEGGREENQALLDQKFDYIFFTGGVSVGREVMRRAAENLTPVTLELGGKSPCIIDATANIKLAAKRIAFGKLLNCGQTCVAPDYVLVDRSVHDAFVLELRHAIERMAGMDALTSDSYVRMVTKKHFDRVLGLIDPDKVVLGGKADPETLKIQPTVMTNVTPDDAVMQEEIFGPVLPVLAVEDLDEAIAFVNARPHPLALYLFTGSRDARKNVLASVPFGGGCINDTIIHLATSRMGFGGVGQSGMGSYHGRKSFETFSHEKSIVDKSTLMDMPIRYMPYTRLKSKLLRFFLR